MFGDKTSKKYGDDKRKNLKNMNLIIYLNLLNKIKID